MEMKLAQASLPSELLQVELLGQVRFDPIGDSLSLKPGSEEPPPTLFGSISATVVDFALDLPEDTTVNEFTVGPANQPW